MKRFFAYCLALTLSLALCTPASAVDLAGPLGESAKPHVLDTGRGYLLYYELSSGMYYSEDQQNWTDLSERSWAKEGMDFNGGLKSKSYQILWTGTEYMMCQSLRDSPRETDVRRGDSPRNKMVTFLDTDWNILGVKAFDAPVTAIRYQDGTYYATVGAVEQSFTRSEWDPGPHTDASGTLLGDIYTGRFKIDENGTRLDETYYIRERHGDNTPFSLAISWDGCSWVPLETKMTPDMMRLAETKGGTVACYDAYRGEIYYYQISEERIYGSTGKNEDNFWGFTGSWTKAELGFDPVEGMSQPDAQYTFRWTGKGYLMSQSVGERGGMMGSGAQGASPRNTVVTLLDKDFHRVSEYDLGAPVTGIACVAGVCYAEVANADSQTAIYRSSNGRTWSQSDLTAFPAGSFSDPWRGTRERAAEMPAQGNKAWFGWDTAQLDTEEEPAS